MVEEGEAAPDFSVAADDGSTVALRDFLGRKVVLYFYPKDDTPGCTIEACEFRDALPDLEERGAVLLGVSPDPPASHRKFKEKHGLNFPLLADEDHEVAKAYGVWKEKSLYGRKHWGVARTTFLIDEDGRVAKVWRKVRPEGHAEAVTGEL
jgi:thioredoxin-dependent peroxiredoxin